MVTSEIVQRLTLAVDPCIKQILPWYQERDFDHYRGPQSNKNALSAGTLWSWLQAQVWTRDSAVGLVIISSSRVQGFHCCVGRSLLPAEAVIVYQKPGGLCGVSNSPGRGCLCAALRFADESGQRRTKALQRPSLR